MQGKRLLNSHDGTSSQYSPEIFASLLNFAGVEAGLGVPDKELDPDEVAIVDGALLGRAPQKVADGRLDQRNEDNQAERKTL